MVELDGKPAENVRISFAGPVAAAREINAQEQPVGSANVSGGELVTSFTAYQPKTFAIRLVRPKPGWSQFTPSRWPCIMTLPWRAMTTPRPLEAALMAPAMRCPRRCCLRRSLSRRRVQAGAGENRSAKRSCCERVRQLLCPRVASIGSMCLPQQQAATRLLPSGSGRRKST